MTLHAVVVPKWGLAMEEAKLAAWLVADGAEVAVGQEIAEIETSKIANALEAPAGGVLRRRVAQVGDVTPVGGLLAVLDDGASDEAEIDAFVAACEARIATEAAVVAAPPMAQTVTLGDTSMRFLKLAAAEGGAGAPVVFIHGFGGDHLNWMFSQSVLAAERDAYAIDLPGHGGSSKGVGDGTLQALAERTIDWLDSQGLTRVHLVGHSMGAAVAATVGLAHPQRVKSIVAVCGAGFGDLDPAYVEGFLAAPRRKELKPVVEMLFADPAMVTREMVEDLLAYKRIDGVPEALRALIDNALSEASLGRLRERLGELQPAVLDLYGEQDRVLAAPPSACMAGGSRIIDRAGHMPHLEAAPAINAAIADFIRSQD